MNTKTMRLPPRRVLTPVKRKERDGVVPVAGKPPGTSVMKPPPPPTIPPAQSVPRKAPATSTTEPAGSNQLLAGYLAHEFLTKGTLFGEQWDPVGSQTEPVPVQPAEPTKSKQNSEPAAEPSERKRRRYVEVANLLRADGTHLPRIVNPAQLARFLKL